jgi:hypothetical protein
VTKDNFADFAPAFAPDGKSLVYTARISGNDKLFQLTLGSGEKKQLTFGTHDDTAAKFYNQRMIVFTSTAIDPNASISPEVARNANIPNVWTLDLGTGELQQLTDTMSGNVSPVILRSVEPLRVAFVSYFKGQDGIHTITGDKKPVATVASADFGSPGPIIDFTPPLSHTLVRDNITKKRRFQGMSLAGRPPVGLGVTSGGNFYGNTEITFTDLLGDRQVSFYAQSVSQFRTMAFTYLSIENRLQYALQGFSSDTFYYGQSQYLYDPSLAPCRSRPGGPCRARKTGRRSRSGRSIIHAGGDVRWVFATGIRILLEQLATIIGGVWRQRLRKKPHAAVGRMIVARPRSSGFDPCRTPGIVRRR